MNSIPTVLFLCSAILASHKLAIGNEVYVRDPMDDPPNIRILKRIHTSETGHKSLRLFGTHVRNAEANLLRAIPLSKLDLCKTSITDFTFLTNMPLHTLNLGENPGIKDLSPLSKLPLKHLTLWSCPNITNLAPLAKLPLHTLELRGCKKLTDLKPIHKLQLKWLSIGQTAIADLSPLTSMPLEFIEMHDCAVTDVTPLLQTPLVALFFSPERITVGMEKLRRKKSLLRINHVDASAFWKSYDTHKSKEPEPDE